MSPTGEICLDETELRIAVTVDVHLKATPRSGLARIASLRVARIRHCRRIRGKNRTRVNVPECPIIETGCRQFVESHRGVVRMTGLSCSICVKQAEGEGRARMRHHRRCQMFRDSLARIADSRYTSELLPAADYRYRTRLTGKRRHVGWKLELAAPAI